MEAFDTVLVLRSLERILVVLSGALAIYLGYRLFRAMPDQDKSRGKVVLPGGISIYLSRVGPGAFFSLFGTIVIGLSLHYGVSVQESVAPPAAAGPDTAVAGPAGLRSYSGAAPAAGSGEVAISDAERNSVLVTVRGLNKLTVGLDGASATDRIDIEQAVLDAKMRLLRSVWDERAWGPYPDFERWVRGGELDPPPAGVAVPARLFRAGRLPVAAGGG